MQFAVHKSLIKASHLRSSEHSVHTDRVGLLSGCLCDWLGCGAELSKAVHFAAIVHDIGKLTLPDSILYGPRRLDPHEREQVRNHTVAGHDVLAAADVPEAAFAASVALNHHEYWDGSGYPNGLAGEAIPREARIVTVCDVYEAMRSERSYKKPMAHEEVMRAMLRGDDEGRTRPQMFDPVILPVLAANADLFGQMYDSVVSLKPGGRPN